MQCAHSCDGAAVAASLSNREIKVYDRASLAPKVRPFISKRPTSTLAQCHVPVRHVRGAFLPLLIDESFWYDRAR